MPAGWGAGVGFGKMKRPIDCAVTGKLCASVLREANVLLLLLLNLVRVRNQGQAGQARGGASWTIGEAKRMD